MSRIIHDENSTQASIKRDSGDMGRREHTTHTPAIAAITFDVTPTLIHAPRRMEIYSEVLARHGITTDPASLSRVIPRVRTELSCLVDPQFDRFTRHPGGERSWWHHFLKRVCQHLESPPPTRFTSAELFDRFARADAWEIYPDVLPTLEALTATSLRLGIVSNWDHRLPGLLERLDLARFFDYIAYSSACGVEKPHPFLFEDCLENLRVNPRQTLHVGDHPLNDVEGAEGAGLRALRVDRRRAADDSLHSLEPLLDLCETRANIEEQSC